MFSQIDNIQNQHYVQNQLPSPPLTSGTLMNFEQYHGVYSVCACTLLKMYDQVKIATPF